jgi:hypothetical protein
LKLATSNSRDVALVIKARDEASRAIDTISSSLTKLFGSQEQVAGSANKTGTSIAEMAKIMAGVDKAVAAVASSADRAEQRFDSLSASVARRKQDLAQFTREAEEAARLIAKLSSPDAIVAAGRDQGGRIAQLRALEAAYPQLERKIESTTRSLAEEQRALDGSRSSLQQLSSTAIGAVQAQEKITKALNDRRDALAAIRAEEEASARGRAFVGDLNARISPTLAGQSAASNGATFSALAAREEAQALRDAAKAHEIFEARVRLGAKALRDDEAKALRDAAAAHQNFENRVKQGAKALKEEQDATKAYEKALEDLRHELDPLIALEERYQAKLALVRKGYADGKVGAKELADAERLLANERKRAEADVARNGKQGVAIFGLRPYELTNLSYQINDVFTQLASGTSLTQTLAQQGGQILQLFPKVGASIAAAFSNPYFIGAAVVFGGIAFAIKQVADESERLRTITATLELNAAGDNYQADALLRNVDNMRAFGASAKDAMAAVKTFVEEGLKQDRIDQFGESAINMARVLGLDVPTAAKQMAEAFSGGYDAIVKLDESTNFLTATQREHIRTLFEQGKAEEARAYALDIFTNKMDSVADKQRGSWEQASKSFRSAWENLKSSLADTSAAQAAYGALESLANILDRIAMATDGKRTIADVNAELKGLTANIDALQARMKANPANAELYREMIRGLEQRIAQLNAERARLAVAPKGGVTNENDPDSAAGKRRNDTIAQLNREQELEALRRKADRERLTNAEKARREELAGLAAIRGESDSVVAAAKRKLAVEKEHAAILKDEERIVKSTAAAAKTAAAERERAIQQFNGRVVGAEGGTAKNKNSSAVGYGQFIDSTWLEQFRKAYKDMAQGLSDDQILALRNNQAIAKGVIDQYARENAKLLEAMGKKVTAGNLYLMHFLGAGDAKKVLNAQGDTPVDQLLGKKVLQGNRGYLYQNGRARTADELEAFIAQRVGDTGTAQSAGAAEMERLIEAQEEAQERFNRSVEKGNEERQRSIDAMRVQNQLQDTALLAAQREIAIAKAEFDLRQRVADMNANLKDGQKPIEVTDEQIAKTRELAAAEFDLANARQQAQAETNEVTKPIEQLTAERDALQARIDYLNSNGLYDQAKSLVPELTETNSALREAIDNAIEFYETLDLSNDALHRTPEELRATIERLKTAKDEARSWITVMGIGGKTIAQTFSSSAVNAIDSFAQAIANGQNAFGALWASFRSFAADFLLQIAKMIQQQIIFNLISGLLKGALGGLGGASGAGAFGGNPWSGINNPWMISGVAHSGGIAGQGLQQRPALPQWFANAARYHTGGIAGLAPDEVPIIARLGEEILTEDNPRHRNNGGMSPQDIKVINAWDAGDMLSQALETKAGQRIFLNWVSRNSRAVQQAMGG